MGRLHRIARRRGPRPTFRMTTHCCNQTVDLLRESTQLGLEGIVYFVGLTNGETTVAVSAVMPEAETTPTSFDVSAIELGEIIRTASLSGLQVVGQLHTHPTVAYHSGGDLQGMHIRYPGFVSIVVPDYGARLPSLKHAHTLIWTNGGFQEISGSIELIDEFRP